jgi:aldehyde:ferredoxin oxidoreductase
MANTILTRNYYCGRCIIGCGQEAEIKEGSYIGMAWIQFLQVLL